MLLPGRIYVRYGLTVTGQFAVPPLPEAVTVTSVSVDTADVVTGNVALMLPAGTTTLVTAMDGSSLESVTLTSEAATPVSVTVLAVDFLLPLVITLVFTSKGRAKSARRCRFVCLALTRDKLASFKVYLGE